jgi:hypothetical protein
VYYGPMGRDSIAQAKSLGMSFVRKKKAQRAVTLGVLGQKETWLRSRPVGA